MGKAFLMLLAASLVLLQGCKSDDLTPDSPGASSSSSSSSSASSSSSGATISSSSSSSSSGGVAASIGDAVLFARELNKVGRSINLEANAVNNLGSILVGDDSMVYGDFAEAFESSSISGAREANPQLLSSEVNNVLAALSQAGSAIAVAFMSHRVHPTLFGPADDSIDVGMSSPVVVESGRYYNELTTLTVNDVISLENAANACAGSGAASCDIEVALKIQIELRDDGVGGHNIARDWTIFFPEFAIHIVELSASNSYISLNVAAGQNVFETSALELEGARPSENEKIKWATVWLEDMLVALSLQITDKTNSDVSIAANIEGSIPGGGLLHPAIGLSFEKGEPFTVRLGPIEPATLNAELEVSAATGELRANVAADANVIGMMGNPFAYVFDEEFEKVGESATNYLGLNATGNYSAVVGGNTLIDGGLVGGRSSNETVALEQVSVNYGGATYVMSGEFSESGEPITLDATDPVSGGVIEVNTVNGARSGTVRDASRTVLGNIADNADGKRVITYIDGTKQFFAIFEEPSAVARSNDSQEAF